MTIRKKSKEELQSQAEWFLDFADKTGKITEKQKEKLSKILGISDSEKKGFFEWLSKRVGNWIYDEEIIGKKLTQGNLLHRGLRKYLSKKYEFGIYKGYDAADLQKDINNKGYFTTRSFDNLWEKYCYYLRFKKYFEKYKTSSDIVNYKFIDHLSSRCSDVDYYKKHQNDHSYRNDRDYYKKEFLKKSEKYKIFKENFDILMNSGVHKQADWITAIEDNERSFYDLDEIFNEANPVNLKIILDKYPNIKIKTLFDWSNRSFFREVKNENLCILFEKFPEIDTEALFDYRFSLEKKLKDSNFKNYITKLFNFFPNITLNEFLQACKNISIENLLACNNADDCLKLICKIGSFEFDIYKLLFDHYKSLFLDKIGGGRLEIERKKFIGWCHPDKLESIKMVLNKFQNIEPEYLILLKDVRPENLKMIFEKYPEIKTNEFILLLVNNDEAIKMILNKFQNIEPEYLILLKDVRPENLKMIFEEYPNIKIDEMLLLENENTNTHILSSVKLETLTVIFEKYPKIQIGELAGLKYIQSSNFKVILEGFWPIDFPELNQYKDFFNLRLPITLNFKEKDHKGYIKFLNEIMDTNYDYDEKSSMIEFLVTLTFEEAKNYLKTFQKLDNSISPDIQLVKNELIKEVLKSNDPLILADTIVGIFEKNNIPLTGQIFKVFELLYPQSRIQELFKKYPYSSPKLKSLLDEGEDMYKLIYKDLMNISIKSGDRTLRDYLMVFVGSEELLKRFENIVSSDGFNGNDENCLEGRIKEGEQEKLLYLFRKISILCSRYLGKQLNELEEIEHGNYGKYTITDNKLVSLYYEIKKGFNLRGGKSIYGRLQSLLYVNGLKYHSVQEVLNEMNKSKRHAHERGLKLYNEATGGKIKFPDEAFVKGVSDLSFKKIIGTGIRSREYLGSGYDLRSTGVCGAGRGNTATSDTTPFDIDGFCSDHFVQASSWGRIAGDGEQDSIGYGYVNFVVDITKTNENGNPKFYDNTPDNNGANKFRRNTIRRREFDDSVRYDDNQYELFQTSTSEGMEHCGIRTGIPMTEVDYIIYTGNFESKEYQDTCYEIARNGYYIPVTDKDGMIKFTPEMYHRIRAGFNYMQYYDGFDVEQIDGKWVSTESDNKVNKEYTGTNEKIKEQPGRLKKLIAENSPSNEKYSKFAKENNKLAKNTINQIIKILEDNFKIIFKSQFDTSITGAEIYDSGSTGRGTDIPTKDVDLDFTLILDEKDYEKIDEIKRVIHEEIGTQRSKDHEVNELSKEKNERIELGNQLKSEINNIGKSESRPNGVPLDLLILKKSQVIHYSSSDAMKEKLNFIEKNLGKEDYDWVRTNIIIMKKLLKSKGCYKHQEGGIAGIGVENWITENHGSFIEALESFEQVAYEGEYEPGKQSVPLEEFKKRYPMYDSGENYKDGGNDNFVYKINESKNSMAYESILQIIQALRTKGIKGIEELIKEYERNKKEHIG